MDYSTHIQTFSKARGVPLYYLCHICCKMPLLLSLSLLIATIKTLSSLTVHFELAAFGASAISLKRVARPFCLFAGL